MTLREKRLRADADLVSALFAPGSRIRLCDAEGDPPERYRLEYHVRGLVVRDGKVETSERHQIEIFLTLAYPRQAPQCRMLTPVFHPNIAPHAICIGDHWSAGESLAALIVRIAEMLTYQSYNVKSPLNGDAARWAEEHLSELPLEEFDFGSLLDPEAPESFVTVAPCLPLAPPPPAVGPAGGPVREETVAPASAVSVSQDGPSPARNAGEPCVDSRLPAGEAREIVCDSCSATLSLPATHALAWARCPLCGRMLRVAPD